MEIDRSRFLYAGCANCLRAGIGISHFPITLDNQAERSPALTACRNSRHYDTIRFAVLYRKRVLLQRPRNPTKRDALYHAG